MRSGVSSVSLHISTKVILERIMKMRLHHLPLLLFLSLSAFAQEVTITDSTGLQHLQGVIVVDEHNIAVISDTGGKIDASRFVHSRQIVFSLTGFEKVKKSYTDLAASAFLVRLNQTTYKMQDVTVFGPRRISPATTSSPAEATQVPARDFYRGSEMSLENTLNIIPDVRLEESTIRIRGLGAVSRFGMRDVGVYYNGMPLHGADGLLFFDDADISAFGSGGVIKGPSSISYGASPAGTMVFDTKKARYREMDLNEIFTTGPYGLLRTNSNYRAGDDNSTLYTSFGSMSSDGYREHSHSTREFLTMSGIFFPSEKQTVSILLLGSSVDEQLPGELDENSFSGAPRMANPTYIQNDLSQDGKDWYMGVTHDYELSRGLWHTFSISLSNVSRQGPRVPYIDKFGSARINARTTLSGDLEISGMPAVLDVGVEVLHGVDNEQRWNWDSTHVQGVMYFNRDGDLTKYFAFIGGKISPARRLWLSSGLHLTGGNDVFTDNVRQGGTDFSAGRLFQPYLTPLLEVCDTLADECSLTGVLSGGYSIPSADEIISSNTAIDTGLSPEKYIGVELGARGSSLAGRLRYGITFFDSRLNDCFVPYTQDGISYLRNARQAESRGVECTLEYLINVAKSGWISALRQFVTFSYLDFKYRDYRLGGFDYTGNLFPGVAPVLFNAGLDASTPMGIYFYATYFLTGKRELEDDNLSSNPSYGILNLKLGWRKRLWKQFTLQTYAGIDNVTNVRYSPTLAVNQIVSTGSLRTYFDPAPGRTVYGALNLEFHFAE